MCKAITLKLVFMFKRNLLMLNQKDVSSIKHFTIPSFKNKNKTVTHPLQKQTKNTSHHTHSHTQTKLFPSSKRSPSVATCYLYPKTASPLQEKV